MQLETRQIINALEVVKSKNSSKEQIKEAEKFLYTEGIVYSAFHKEKDIERVWNGRLALFARNVVRINKKVYSNKYSEKFTQCFNGTGTLIDVGKPGLEGRVLLTCAHVMLPNIEAFCKNNNNNIKKLFSPINGSDQIISIHSQKLRHFERINVRYFSREGWFDFGESDIALSAEAECQRGEFLDNIPITDIYVLTSDDEGTMCCDVAVCILKEPVKCKGEIVPGVRLDELNVFTETEKIDAIPPWHHIHLGRSLREVLPMDKCPVVIGYGVTGLKDGQIPCHLRSSFSAEQMRSFWRLGIKKAIILKGLDLNGQGHLQNMQGCMCAEFPRAMTEFLLSSLEAKCHQHIQSYNEYIGRATAFLQRVKHFQESKTVTPRTRETMMRLLPEQVKQFLEKAKNEKNEIERIIAENRRHLELFGATKPSYSAPLSGGGFSGSLVVRKSDDERYDVFGIFGGPLFTSEIKDFIENAAQYHHEKLSLRKRWARHLGQFWGMDPFIFSKIKRISFTGSNFIPGSWGTDFCNR